MMRSKSLFLFGLILLASTGVSQAQTNCDAKDKPKPKYGRGYVAPSKEILDARHEEALKRHGKRMKTLPVATAPTFDCRALGWAVPIKDQASCGSCYQFSGAMVCSAAFWKAGFKAQVGDGFAEQYGMDCQNWGGCNGGDEADIIIECKRNGLPTLADYGPYLARSTSCKLKSGTKLWKIADWGYCHSDQGQGIATVQDIKNAMTQYGAISIAIDASAFDNYSGGVMSGTGHSIDHAIQFIGWDDSKGTKGAWLAQNQWGTGWGESGYAWIAYGAYDGGTEAMWVTTNTLPPPPPPTGSLYSMKTNTDGSITFTPVPASATISVTRSTTLGEILDAINSGKLDLAPKEKIDPPKKLPKGDESQDETRLNDIEKRLGVVERVALSDFNRLNAVLDKMKEQDRKIADVQKNPYNPYAEVRK